jgi:hypothetical protein
MRDTGQTYRRDLSHLIACSASALVVASRGLGSEQEPRLSVTAWRVPAFLLGEAPVGDGSVCERYAKPIRECRPLGPARAIGAGERPAATAGSLHNANFRIRHSLYVCRFACYA